jgi:hypothetical protein
MAEAMVFRAEWAERVQQANSTQWWRWLPCISQGIADPANPRQLLKKLDSTISISWDILVSKAVLEKFGLGLGTTQSSQLLRVSGQTTGLKG